MYKINEVRNHINNYREDEGPKYCIGDEYTDQLLEWSYPVTKQIDLIGNDLRLYYNRMTVTL